MVLAVAHRVALHQQPGAGSLAADAVIPLGELLAEPRAFAADEIAVIDLTG